MPSRTVCCTAASPLPPCSPPRSSSSSRCSGSSNGSPSLSGNSCPPVSLHQTGCPPPPVQTTTQPCRPICPPRSTKRGVPPGGVPRSPSRWGRLAAAAGGAGSRGRPVRAASHPGPWTVGGSPRRLPSPNALPCRSSSGSTRCWLGRTELAAAAATAFHSPTLRRQGQAQCHRRALRGCRPGGRRLS